MAAQRYPKDPTECNLKPLRQGDSKSYGITITDELLVAIDITGDKFYFTIKDDSDREDVDALLQVSVTAPVGADATAGKVTLVVTSADSAAVKVGAHDYDIIWVRATSSPGDVVTIQIGQIPVKRRVTHAVT